MSTELVEIPPAPPVTVLIEPEERSLFDTERAQLLALLLPDEIVSPQEYTGVAEDRKRIRAFVARVQPAFDKVCADAHAAHRSACRLRDLFMGGLQTLDARAGKLLSRYDTRQEELRRAEERRLAEEERQRQVAAQREEAKLLDRQGHKDEAKALRNTPVEAPAVVLPRSTPRVEGLTYRDNWKWRPIGGDTPENRARALALMVPAQFRQFLQFNDAAMNAFAKHTKGAIKVPGVEFYNDRIPVQR
jgi:hypothetical protein